MTHYPQVQQEFRYRVAHDADIDALLQFVPLTLQGSWSVDVLQRLLRAHKVRVLEEASSQRIIGFAEFTQVLDESELLSLAIDPLWQRRGLGKLLLTAVLQEVAGLGVVRILLEVRASNAAARGLYQQHGFVQDGVRRGYYAAPALNVPPEDACLYSLELESSSRA